MMDLMLPAPSTPRPSRRAARALIVALTLAAVQLPLGPLSPSHAAPPGPGPRPLVTPWSFAPELEGAESTMLHAAGLGFLDGFELTLTMVNRLSGDAALAGVSGAIAARLGPLALGLSLAGIGDGPGTQTNSTRFDLALALRLSDTFAIGAQRVDIGSGTDPEVDNYAAWTLSSTWRPSRGFALSLAFEEVDSPIIPGTLGVEADPTARLAFGFRPGTDKLTFGLEAARTLADDNARWQAMATARLMMVRGLWLGTWVRYHFGEEGGDSLAEGGVSLGLSQGGVELSSGLDLADGPDTPMRLATMLRVGTQRHPNLIPNNRKVVRLQLSGELPERPGETLFGSPTPGFAHWLVALDMMAHDDEVTGLVLQIDAAPTWAQCWELRESITRFKAKNKKVLAVLTVGDARAHYLASAADQVHLYAAGGLLLTGLAISQTYYFGLMEKLGIRADLVRYEAYKSAPEPLTQSGPSDASVEQTKAILDGMYDEWLTTVSTGRNLTREALITALDNGPQTMHAARDQRLVDGLVEADALGELVREIFGADVDLVRGYVPPVEAFTRWGKKQKVAIIPVVGGIVDGPSSGSLPLPIPFIGGETTGDATFIAALDQALADPDVVGIVVRVDSGGGSAVASDRMHRAVLGAKRQKPIVISFGNVAASGGYYLAAGATIFSTPVTITGSIGIFAGKVDLSGLYAMLGITTFTQRTNERADMMSPFRPYTDEERKVALATIKAYYDRFVGLVAEGRQMSVAEVEVVARGRVWLGRAAHDRKLVDTLAGLWDAMNEVRAQAGYGPEDDLGITYMGSLGAFSSLQRLIGGVFFDEPASGLSASVGSAGGTGIDAPTQSNTNRELAALGVAVEVMKSEGPLAILPSFITID